jgi:Pyridoxamine 5'-phosphate oxidase
VTEDLEMLRRLFRDQPACRVATVRPHGGPHVATRWFVWMSDALYVATRVGDTTWAALEHDARVSLLVDRGREWNDLSGVRIEGVAELLPAEHPDLRQPMSAWHEKYRTLFAGDGFERFTAAIPKLGFLRVVPAVVDAWDHG